MLCVTKAYALPDVDVIILDFFFKSATLELIEVLPAKDKTLLIQSQSNTLQQSRSEGFHQEAFDYAEVIVQCADEEKVD